MYHTQYILRLSGRIPAESEQITQLLNHSIILNSRTEIRTRYNRTTDCCCCTYIILLLILLLTVCCLLFVFIFFVSIRSDFPLLSAGPFQHAGVIADRRSGVTDETQFLPSPRYTPWTFIARWVRQSLRSSIFVSVEEIIE